MPSVDLIGLALVEAQSARQLSSPNPGVGCVLASCDGVVLGRGSTQTVGNPHAEVMALHDAQAQGNSVVGATAYVTLEPCSHHGRTGPCCDALIAAGITKVVATNTDPNPLVAGQGFARLRAAGVEVNVLAADDPLAIQSRELNIGFFSRMVRNRPWVRMKIAASLDGFTALPSGVSQWITGAAARADGHAWRARACAVLTGIGTVRQDDPRLDVRLVETVRQPQVIVVDSQLETPPDAAILVAGRPTLIYAAVLDAARRTALERRGVTVVYSAASGDGARPGVDLTAMLRDLALREINELHVEAGVNLNGSLIAAGLVDEFLVYLAPKLIGQGLGMANIGPLGALSDAVALDYQSAEMVGADLRVIARVPGCDQF